MRETSRHGKKSVSRSTQQGQQEQTRDISALPIAAADQPDGQTIKLPSLQGLLDTQGDNAETAHAVDTNRMVQEAEAPRNRRSGRRKPKRTRGPIVALTMVLAVLLVWAFAGLLAPGQWLRELMPDRILGAINRPTPTAETMPSPIPLVTAAPTPQPAADLGATIVILDGLNADQPAFGVALESQLQSFGKANHVKTEYVRCNAEGIGQSYARLASSGTAPVLLVGPYEALRSMGQHLSDWKDAGVRMGLNDRMLKMGGDPRILPLNARLNGVFVRKSLWKGELPVDYDQLLTGLKAMGGNAPESFPLGLPLGSASGEAFCRDMLAAYGADLNNPSACNPQDVALVLAWFQTVFDHRLAPTDSLDWDIDQARKAIATVSAVTAAEGTLLRGLDGQTAADLELLPPLRGPRGRFCTAEFLGMAMPSAANPEAARLFYETCFVQQRGMEAAMQGDIDGLPAPDKLLQALDPAKNPWAKWLDQLDGVTVRANGAGTGPAASRAVAAVAVGSYTPEEAAQWLLAKQ